MNFLACNARLALVLSCVAVIDGFVEVIPFPLVATLTATSGVIVLLFGVDTRRDS